MSTGNKLYYPKTHIVTNLHTSGKEWMFEDGTEYIGYYHRYIDGVKMSGAVFQQGYSKKLIPYLDIVSQPGNTIYDSLKKKQTYTAPYQTYPIPVIDDYEAGKIVRYFIKRRNFSTFEDIIEINKSQYKLWLRLGSGIDETLYDAITLDWKLTGPLYDVLDTANPSYGVYDTNFRMVQLKNKTFRGLKDFLTDFTELSIYSPYVDMKYKDLFGLNK